MNTTTLHPVPDPDGDCDCDCDNEMPDDSAATEPVFHRAGPTDPRFAPLTWTVTITPLKGAPTVTSTTRTSAHLLGHATRRALRSLVTVGDHGLPVRVELTGRLGTTVYTRPDRAARTSPARIPDTHLQAAA